MAFRGGIAITLEEAIRNRATRAHGVEETAIAGLKRERERERCYGDGDGDDDE